MSPDQVRLVPRDEDHVMRVGILLKAGQLCVHAVQIIFFVSSNTLMQPLPRNSTRREQWNGTLSWEKEEITSNK